jgi:hypothetical protein
LILEIKENTIGSGIIGRRFFCPGGQEANRDMSSRISIPWHCAQGHTVIVSYRICGLQAALRLGAMTFDCQSCGWAYTVDRDTAEFLGHLIAAIGSGTETKAPPKARMVRTRDSGTAVIEVAAHQLAFLEAAAPPALRMSARGVPEPDDGGTTPWIVTGVMGPNSQLCT